jgi:hypothetical protein
VIVLGRDDLLVAPDAQAVVRHRQRLRRVGRQAELLRLATDVFRERTLGRGERMAFGVIERGLFYPQRVGIDLLPVELDRVRHRLGCDTNRKVARWMASGESGNSARTARQSTVPLGVVMG